MTNYRLSKGVFIPERSSVKYEKSDTSHEPTASILLAHPRSNSIEVTMSWKDALLHGFIEPCHTEDGRRGEIGYDIF
jgi:hypothetical protein